MTKVTFIIILNIFLLVTQFGMMALISTDGEKVWRLTQLQREYLAKNQAIKQQIYTLSSLPYIKSRSDVLNLGNIQTQFWREPAVAQVSP